MLCYFEEIPVDNIAAGFEFCAVGNVVEFSFITGLSALCCMTVNTLFQNIQKLILILL